MADCTIIDKTFSVATRQYFQRHNLVGAAAVAPAGMKGALEEQGRSETLDIQALKTLPKLT